MRPEPFLAMRAALDRGPDHCPPDLFVGPVDAIVRGLKAHANGIAHARFVAIEESFPRTRALLGEAAFHAIAERHLADAACVRRPQTLLGTGFADRLDGQARDLAAIEWAWLEAHGAADAPPFDLAAIAGQDAAVVATATVVRHPAARLVARADPTPIAWEGDVIDEALILVTRPHAEVMVTGCGPSMTALLDRLAVPRRLEDLLETDPAATTTLVTTGALTLHREILL